MQYETLTDERKGELVESQLQNLEAEHYRLTVLTAGATPTDEQAAQVEELEKRITATRALRPKKGK
jgi:endo-alpha-1,4-polygalactosaminidase (GH114 family)